MRDHVSAEVVFVDVLAANVADDGGRRVGRGGCLRLRRGEALPPPKSLRRLALGALNLKNEQVVNAAVGQRSLSHQMRYVVVKVERLLALGTVRLLPRMADSEMVEQFFWLGELVLHGHAVSRTPVA